MTGCCMNIAKCAPIVTRGCGITDGGGDAVDDAARGDIKFSTTAQALSSRLQVLHRFSYLLNKNSQV